MQNLPSQVREPSFRLSACFTQEVTRTRSQGTRASVAESTLLCRSRSTYSLLSNIIFLRNSHSARSASSVIRAHIARITTSGHQAVDDRRFSTSASLTEIWPARPASRMLISACLRFSWRTTHTPESTERAFHRQHLHLRSSKDTRA
jgi:hypothetical protein